jgi:hypothetical protein
MHGLDIAEFRILSPFSEVDRGTRLSPAGVRIADIGGEEFDEAPAGVPIKCEQRWQLQGARDDPCYSLGISVRYFQLR